MKKAVISLSFIFISQVVAFSSIHIPPTATPPPYSVPRPSQFSSSATTTTTTTESYPWRIVLNIGREPLATMPFDWARSGCRLPIVIPCEFSENSSHSRNDNNNNNNNQAMKSIQPMSETVSFTGPDGAVIRPVQGGNWILKDEKELSFELTFPEALARRDVTIEAGSTIHCFGTIYTQTELDQLNQNFYTARENTWKVGVELNTLMDRQDAPKKWNEETRRWEQRYTNTNPVTWAQKQVEYWKAKTVQNQKNKQRPNPNDLSGLGQLPGLHDSVYVARSGVLKASNGAVMGTWTAEPITNRPVSYTS